MKRVLMCPPLEFLMRAPYLMRAVPLEILTRAPHHEVLMGEELGH